MKTRLRSHSFLGFIVVMTLIATACSTSTPPDSVRLETGSSPTEGADLTAESEAGEPGSTTGTPTDRAVVSEVRERTAGGAEPSSPGRGPDNGPVSEAGSAVGVTASEVKISVVGPFSGVYAALGREMFSKGFEVWLKEINANGGIHGRRVVVKLVDNAYTADGASVACTEVRSNGTFMAVHLVGFSQFLDCMEAVGIPALDSLPTHIDPSWQFVNSMYHPPTVIEPVVSFLKSDYMKAGDKKIGIIHTEEAVHVAESKATEAELRKQGLKFVHSERVGRNQASFVSEMTRMRNSGAETVLVIAFAESPSIIRDARAIGYAPQWYARAGLTRDLILQACGNTCEGIRGLRVEATTESPEYEQYRAKVEKYQGSHAASTTNTTFMFPYAQGRIAGEMLNRAGSNPTRPLLATATKEIEKFDPLVTVPFGLKGRSAPVGMWSLRPIVCCNSDNTYKALGPPREKF